MIKGENTAKGSLAASGKKEELSTGRPWVKKAQSSGGIWHRDGLKHLYHYVIAWLNT